MNENMLAVRISDKKKGEAYIVAATEKEWAEISLQCWSKTGIITEKIPDFLKWCNKHRVPDDCDEYDPAVTIGIF